MPIAVACSCPFFSYMDDRIHWASFGYGRYSQPLLESYFNFPGLLALFAIIPALAEEIAWRGYVQPRFIQLHGLARGIFFTGIVWGAFHFTFDFGPRLSEADVLVAVLRRLTMAIAISVALAWITIRSGSVWPAAIFHGLYNILLGVAKQPALPLAPWSAYAIWMLLGLVLFRFWPPKTQIVSDLAPGVDTLQEPDQVD
jgi:membrane protease YdiL (CAAX protease family)